MLLRRSLVLWLLAALPAAAQEAAPAAGILLRPTITMEGEAYKVTIEGQTRLPDGAVVLLELSPVESGGKSSGVLCASKVEVRGGGFAMATPWTVRRESLTVPSYRVEARLADDQPQKIRGTLRRTGSSMQASMDIPLGDWRTRSSQILPVAKVLAERMAAFVRHRDGLLAMAREQTAGKLSAGTWNGWRGRTELLRDRKACEDAVTAPVPAGTFPRSCAKAQTILGQFDGIFFAIDGELRGGVGAGNPERKAMLKLADRDIPPDYLRDFYQMVGPEGASQLARALEEVVVSLKLPAAGKPVAAAVFPAAERDLAQIFTQSEAFFAGEWAADAVESHRAIMDLLGAARKLVDDTKVAAGKAEAQAPCAAAREDLLSRLSILQGTLKKRLDQ